MRREARKYDHRRDSKFNFETSAGVSVKSSFEDFGLKEDLLRGIYAYSKWIRFFSLTAR